MSIKSDAIIIRDETVSGANTATRVGTNLVAIADDLLAKQTAIDLNTAKTSYTDASQVATNTSDIATIQGEQTTQDAAIALNTAKVGITPTQASDITSNNSHRINTLNPHSVTKTQVGLANVDNTSDLSKPISTATQSALDAKQATLVSGTNIKTINGTTILGAGDIVISGGGSTTFSALTDTPSSYTGNAGLFPKVNAGETALEFANAFDVYSDSPIKPIFWGSNQAQFDVKFPSGAPTNVFSVITDAVTPPIEGTDISSTAVTVGYVLQADGDGTSSWIAPSGGTDANAIHDNVSNEISVLTLKSTPTNSDVILIEDTASSASKKAASLASLPISTATQNALNAKQATLVSGTNIKTINGATILGAGDIVISGGGSSTLIGLTDTPSSYTAQGGKILAVNQAGTAVEFLDILDYEPTLTRLSVGTNLDLSSFKITGVGNATVSTDAVNKGQLDSALTPYLTSSTAASTYEPLKGVDDNYVTDAEKVVIGNTSGTNTGDDPFTATKISGETLKSTLAGTEEVLINDAGTLKKTTAQDIADLGGGGASTTQTIADEIYNKETRLNKQSFLPQVASNTYTVTRAQNSISVSGNTSSFSLPISIVYNTTAVAGTIASQRGQVFATTITDTFNYSRGFKVNSNITDSRFFVGLSEMYRFSVVTNIEPNAMTNSIGVCKLSTSDNLHIIYNDGTGTATTVDLGVNYPATNTTNYSYRLNIFGNSTDGITIKIIRTDTSGTQISTEVTTTTDINTGVTHSAALWITNNASASIASLNCLGGILLTEIN